MEKGEEQARTTTKGKVYGSRNHTAISVHHMENDSRASKENGGKGEVKDKGKPRKR